MNVVGRVMNKVVRICSNNSGQLDKSQVDLACSYLSNGGVVALPTDTIYGLAAKIEDSNALERIYKIKGRDQSKPLAICVSHIDLIDEIADTSVLKRDILESLMPGSELVGVRIPDHNFIRAVSHFVGPLALTSANRSGETSPLVIDEFKPIWPELDCIFDAGLLQTLFKADPRSKRLGSSVIDMSVKNEYKIIRAGCALNRARSILNRFGFRDTTGMN